MYAGGVLLIAFSDTPVMLSLSLGLLAGLGIAGSSFAIVLAAFGRIMPPERRSQALGLGTAAGSMGQFLLVPVSQVFLDSLRLADGAHRPEPVSAARHSPWPR